MRIHKGILAVSALGLFVGALQACATEVVDVADEDSGVTPPVDASKTETSTNRPDTSVPGRDTGTPDTSRPDTGNADTSTADAADSAVGPRAGEPFDPLAPAQGANCPAGVALNGIVERRCGKCGTQKAFCEAQPGGGANKIGVYSGCTGEKVAADACLPRERIVSACGFCGTQAKECDTTCSYIEGTCSGQVVGGCVAGTVTYVEGVCNGAGQTPTDVRRQTCSAACTLGAAEPCAPRPLDEILASPTVGTVAGGEFTYFPTKLGRLTVGACASTTESATLASSHYARIRNGSAQSINVTIINRAIAGATSVPDVLVAIYPGASIPADRKACVGAVRTIPEAFNVDIPANSSIVFHTMSNTGSPTKLKLEVTTNYVGAGPQPLTLPTGANLTISTEVVQDVGRKADRLSVPISDFGACPRTIVTPSTTSSTAYTYVEIRNPGATARMVDLATPVSPDGLIAVYGGAAPPADAAERMACTGSTNDTCTDLIDPSSNFDACLPGVVVPANASVWVYVANYSSTVNDNAILQVTTKN